MVTNPKAIAPGHPRLTIATYDVRVEGEGMTPIAVTFDGGTTDSVIDGIPEGADRRVTVVARNVDGEALRAGEVEGVAVAADAASAVTVRLEVIPLFLNVREGNVVPNTRLRMALVGMPGHALTVEGGIVTDAMLAAGPVPLAPLVDASVNAPEVMSDIATGLATFAPRLLAPGRYHFRVRDLTTDRQSAVTVQVTDGARRRGAPLVAAGHARARVSAGNGRWAETVRGGSDAK